MEKKTNNKLLPKVKTVFHFSKKNGGTNIAPSGNTVSLTTVSGPGYIL